ncbi:TadE/TadG family type IV pilus assembly protein [Methylobacterium trifolii]|uniref:TadE-like domain-containing protein n=1 Tax=Methylobacterium trifolii TaxID=1003092 RepID=A0ABQ4TSW1_9HYPH|nr:TadE/TadG family type IV pilus assembly protein [Methylobacterium trifolii]GJE58136.1 hypothetical protein MPOCJGCO_0214 [Methylobacterium trifolii]
MRGALARFAAARGGASAVEFAFIAPLLLGLFMGAVEIPRAIATGDRLALAAGTLADLIARDDSSALPDIFASAQTVAAPYSLDGAGIVLTAAGVYQDGDAFVAKVCSSVQQNDEARAAGSTIGPAPAGMTTNGARFVMAEVRMRYHAIFSMIPVLNSWSFAYKTVWPIREGKTYNGQAEVVLPGGKPCPR